MTDDTGKKKKTILPSNWQLNLSEFRYDRCELETTPNPAKGNDQRR